MHGHQSEYLGARQGTQTFGALSGGWGHGDAGKLGKYNIISFLPDKVARFLYEYHDNRFQRLDLPPIPDDRSRFDVHAALKPEQVVHSNYFSY